MTNLDAKQYSELSKEVQLECFISDFSHFSIFCASPLPHIRKVFPHFSAYLQSHLKLITTVFKLRDMELVLGASCHSCSM